MFLNNFPGVTVLIRASARPHCVIRASKEKFDAENIDYVTGYFISEADTSLSADTVYCQNYRTKTF